MGILNHPILKRIITIIIVVLLLVFIGYQIWRANHSSVVTETATYASISDTIQAEGVIIRNETLVQQNTAGVITYNISDGTKIAKDGLIATVYDTAEDATTQQRREQLESQLATLQELNSARTTTTYTNPDNLDKDIHTKLYTLLESIHERDRDQIDSDKDSVLKSINTRQIATGQVTDFNAKIQSLQDQLTALGSVKGTKKGEITSPSSGYFVSSTDGYESTFSYNDATNLTVDDLKTKKDQKAETQDSSVIGKICDSYNWYVACIVPADTASRLKEDAQVSIQLPFVSSGDIPATVAAVNQTDGASEAAVILKCNYMSDTLSKVRDETIQININTYTGIRVSQQSVRFQTVSKDVTDENGNTTTVTKDVKGVYILYGNSIKFVEIVPLYSSNNYVICDPDPDTSELMTSETLTLYDEVVVGGKDLYDGKMVK
jgi:hypothetical protein